MPRLSTITFCPYSPSQSGEISHLIRRVYDEYVAPDYTEEGNRFFYDWIDPLKIEERQSVQQTIWTAQAEGKIVGMIEMRRNDHVSLLFVDKEWMGKGIARELLRLGLEQSLERDPGMKTVFVHASPFSVPVYEKLGFRAEGEMRVEHGITYLPMTFALDKQ